jgi:copper chaperone CopZ
MYKITLKVEGMMCGHCEAHVNDIVRNNFKVKKVSSSHSTNTTEIITDSDIDIERLTELIQADGYTVLSHDTVPYEKKGFSLFR